MSKDVIAQFAEIVGEANVLTGDADTAPYLKEWRGRWTGKTAAVVRPGGVSTTAITGRPSRSAASSAPGRSPTETTGLTPCRSGRPPPRPRSTWGCPARGPGARRP